jgi:phosphatidylglycerophosphate synthase
MFACFYLFFYNFRQMAIAEVLEAPFEETPSAEIIPFPGSHEKLGAFMEDAADVLVVIRGAGAVVLNRYIEQTPEYQSWQTAGAFVALAATDAVDGWLARTGRKFQGKDESIRRPFKSYPDLLADKGLVDGTTIAIANREEANGNTAYASVVHASGYTYIVRDVITTADRIIADFEDIDSRAQKGGKIKMAKQVGTIAVALSPVAEHPLVKAAVAGSFVYTAKESVSSGVSLHKEFARQRAEKRERGELPLQKWRASRQERQEKRDHRREVFNDAYARKGNTDQPRVLRPR